MSAPELCVNLKGQADKSQLDYGISSVCRRRNDFHKADSPGKQPFAKGFSQL